MFLFPWVPELSLASATSCSVCRWSVKMLLSFASTVIPGFSFLEIHDQYFYSLPDIYFEIGPPLRQGTCRFFYVGVTFVALQFQHEYVRAVTASRSLWTLCTLCHCTILSNIYTKYTEVSCQCRLVQQVMP
jgi:hypothetical protein